nr:reverse transcriptase domain-containing protein [Tanacetum cinerariifolium]
MTDNRTMAEMRCAPTEGCAEAIVVPPILAEQFELKHSLINMMTSEQFFALEKDNPHDHIRCAVTTAMMAMLKQFQSNPPPAQVKGVEEICVTCEGAHPYYQCLAASGNTFPEYQDNIQGYVSAAAGNFNQEETYTDPHHAEYTIKVPPPPPVQKPKPPIQRNFVLHTRDSLPLHILIARDVFVPVGKFTFLADFVIVDYESDPRVPLILGRPFLRTARALIDVHGEEMILRDGDERLTLNMKHDTTSYSNHPYRDSVNLINIFNILSEDSDFKDSIDQSVLTHCDDLFVDPTPEMFTDEQPPDYSFPSRFDVYPDDFLEIKSDATFDDDSFDSEGEKIKEAELLIDQLDLPCDILSEYDSFNSQDFSRDDVLASPDNEDKVFNPGILSHEKSVKIITRFTQEKKLAVSFASWLFEDFDPPFYELLVFKEVPNSMRLLLFSSKNEDKVFKPRIYIFKKFHCCFLSELSHLEMFTDEQPPDYSFPLRFDVYPDDFLEIESDATSDDDSFDSEGEKIKETKLLIDQLDLPCDILF